jgi:hypothetical protein
VRGFPGGDSLARFLAERVGARNRADPPRLTEDMIVAWMTDHHERTGRWPYAPSGPVLCAEGETWLGLQMALVQGHRGLPGGSSLARLRADRLGHRNQSALPSLTEDQIVAWMREHRERTGEWPTQRSGPVAGSGGETWLGVQMALVQRGRGLPRKSSLAKLRRERLRGGR